MSSDSDPKSGQVKMYGLSATRKWLSTYCFNSVNIDSTFSGTQAGAGGEAVFNTPFLFMFSSRDYF